MDEAHYFELADAIARATDPGDLALVNERIEATEMHALERQLLDRAVRARSAALLLGRSTGGESGSSAVGAETEGPRG